MQITVDLVKEIESRIGCDLKTIDIGGGLSASYDCEDELAEFSFQLYRKQLQNEIPDLFTGKYKIITEFGRSMLLKCGVTLTRVEYIKHWIPEVQPIVLTHVGSEKFRYHP